MLDNPSEALDNTAAAFGRGWLLAHLTDLLVKAGQSTPRPVDASLADAAAGATDHALAFREYARALAATPGLWQIAVSYLSPLPRPLARAWVGAIVRGELPASDEKAGKLLALCDAWGLEGDAASIATQMVCRKLRARMPASAFAWFARTPEHLRQRARHDAIARQLVEACGRPGEEGEEQEGGRRAPAAAALARLLGGLVGASAAGGGGFGGGGCAALPEAAWLVEYCDLRAALDQLAALRASAGEEGENGARALAKAEAEARALVLRLCSADGGGGGGGFGLGAAAGGAGALVPQSVRSQLLLDAHKAGILRASRPAGAGQPAPLSAGDVYALIGCMHSVQPHASQAAASQGAAPDAASEEWPGLTAAMQPVALELCLALSSVVLARPQAQP